MQNWSILGPKKDRNSKKYFMSAFFTEEMYTFSRQFSPDNIYGTICNVILHYI